MRWPRFLRVYDDTGRSVRLHYRYLAAIGAAVVFIGLLVVYLPVAMTSTPDFCQNCHLDEGTLRRSGSSRRTRNVNCVKCHVDPGIMKALEHKVLSYKEIFANFFGSGSMPEDIKLPIERVVRAVPHPGPRWSRPAATSRSRTGSTSRCRASSAPTATSTSSTPPAARRSARRPWTSATCVTTARRLPTPAPRVTSTRPSRVRGASGRRPREPRQARRGPHRGLLGAATASARSSARTATASRRRRTARRPGATSTRSRSRRRVATYVTVATSRTSARRATRCSIRRTGRVRIRSSRKAAGTRVWSATPRASATSATRRRASQVKQ